MNQKFKRQCHNLMRSYDLAAETIEEAGITRLANNLLSDIITPKRTSHGLQKNAYNHIDKHDIHDNVLITGKIAI